MTTKADLTPVLDEYGIDKVALTFFIEMMTALKKPDHCFTVKQASSLLNWRRDKVLRVGERLTAFYRLNPMRSFSPVTQGPNLLKFKEAHTFPSRIHSPTARVDNSHFSFTAAGLELCKILSAYIEALKAEKLFDLSLHLSNKPSVLNMYVHADERSPLSFEHVQALFHRLSHPKHGDPDVDVLKLIHHVTGLYRRIADVRTRLESELDILDQGDGTLMCQFDDQLKRQLASLLFIECNKGFQKR